MPRSLRGVLAFEVRLHTLFVADAESIVSWLKSFFGLSFACHAH